MCIHSYNEEPVGAQPRATILTAVDTQNVAKALADLFTITQLKALAVLVMTGGAAAMNPVNGMMAGKLAAQWGNKNNTNIAALDEVARTMIAMLDVAGVEEHFLDKEIAA